MVWHQGCHLTGFCCTCPVVAGKEYMAEEDSSYGPLSLLLSSAG